MYYDAFFAPMIGRTISHYAVLKQIGAGGMGVAVAGRSLLDQ
jgi:hypothetical protein